MGFPNVPNIKPEITLTAEEAATIVLASIGMEELALSHIMNAEGEKIQLVTATTFRAEFPATAEGRDGWLEAVLKVNNSARQTLELCVNKNMVLSSKLSKILDAFDLGDETYVPAAPPPTGP